MNNMNAVIPAIHQTVIHVFVSKEAWDVLVIPAVL